jgi:hypothetical protein
MFIAFSFIMHWQRWPEDITVSKLAAESVLINGQSG